uniref:Cir_N domain-containing protein n=1 Tax=Glossina brevipalpis TaxID=37001 RepID=A0A1A9W2B1_9MUSC
MNILPKKRWHVRTKDNIARVRKDEAAAKVEDLKRQQQFDLAESEARLNFLRKRSGLPEKHRDDEKKTKDTPAIPSCSSNASEEVEQQHFNLFADYKSHVKTTNKDFEKEKKEESEKYEKQIGYLTYLGQDTNEALKLKSWYEVAPKRSIDDKESEVLEKDIKNKHKHDPLTLINALLPATEIKPRTITNNATSGKSNIIPAEQQIRHDNDKIEKTPKKHKKGLRKTKKLKHKKRSKHSKHKKEKIKRDENEILNEKRLKLELLRKERLQREAKERERQEALFGVKELSTTETAPVLPRIKQKYNSQFNPEIAKQNMN